MADDTRETCQVTRVESHFVNYRVALQISCSLFHESLGMGFFSLQMIQFMQVFISERHAVIRSMCAQLPFVSVSNDMCCSVVTILG